MTSRRQFFQTSLAVGAASFFSNADVLRAETPACNAASSRPIVLHQTDCFHPHCDPDDHFDLAAVFGLLCQDALDLRGVLVDYPPEWAGAPAVAAIAQLVRATGKSVPFAFGASVKPSKRGDKCAQLSKSELGAVNFMIETLEKAERPVRILIAGAATDVAIAAARRPELFEAKCEGVYLNAGSAFPSLKDPNQLEYNVTLNPISYASMFDLPCPTYWFPCWHNVGDGKSGGNSAYYVMEHKTAFEGVSEALKGYFTYMFDRSANSWLKAIENRDENNWEKILANKRNMWCTASQLLIANKTVARDGRIVELGSIDDKDALFVMRDIEIQCGDDGKTEWKYASQKTNRKILCVQDAEAYPPLMSKAINSIFREI